MDHQSLQLRHLNDWEGAGVGTGSTKQPHMMVVP